MYGIVHFKLMSQKTEFMFFFKKDRAAILWVIIAAIVVIYLTKENDTKFSPSRL